MGHVTATGTDKVGTSPLCGFAADDTVSICVSVVDEMRIALQTLHGVTSCGSSNANSMLILLRVSCSHFSQRCD